MSTVPAGSRSAVQVAPLLGFAALLPLLPRPTAGLVGLLLVSSASTLLLVSFAVSCARVPLPPPVARTSGLLLAFGSLVVGAELVKVYATEDWSEVQYAAGRALAVTLSLSVFLWVRLAGVSASRVVHAFLLGYLALCCMMIAIAVTGVAIFEELRPSRELGITIPFPKTAGVPRSFGELAILSGLAWAYLLVRRHDLSRPFWWTAAVLVNLSVLISQSRTGLLAWLVVSLAWLLVSAVRSAVVLRAAVLAVLCTPLLVDWVVQRFSDASVVSSVVGQSTFENNVFLRLDLNETALRLLTRSGLADALYGQSRDTWLQAVQRSTGESTELHNHVLAALLFSGVLIGVLVLVVLYLLPLWRLAGRAGDDDARLLYLAGLGSLFALQFYPGFFSLTVSLLVGLGWAEVYGRTRDAPGEGGAAGAPDLSPVTSRQ